jgi:hypothetical protein
MLSYANFPEGAASELEVSCCQVPVNLHLSWRRQRGVDPIRTNKGQEEEAMKILRSVNRRGFNIGTAGWFTVLRQNTWFPASRMPGRFRYEGQGTTQPLVPGQTVLNHVYGQEAKVPSRQPRLSAQDTVRPALITLAAAALTSVLLWWIMHP